MGCLGIYNCSYAEGTIGTASRELVSSEGHAAERMASRSLEIRNYDHNTDASLPLLSSRRPVVPTTPSVPIDQRVVYGSVNLLHQLPTGSVMAFQAMSSYFTNQGECHPANWWTTLGIIILLTVSCIFFSITDSFVFKGKLYYGVAWRSRLILLNLSREQRKDFTVLHRDKLKDLRLRSNDCLHAAMTAAVFLAFVFGDTGIQNCFFPHAGLDTKMWLKTGTLLLGVVASCVLMVCQTERNKIDLLSSTAHPSVRNEDPAMLSNQIREMLRNESVRFRIYPVQATTWDFFEKKATTWGMK